MILTFQKHLWPTNVLCIFIFQVIKFFSLSKFFRLSTSTFHKLLWPKKLSGLFIFQVIKFFRFIMAFQVDKVLLSLGSIKILVLELRGQTGSKMEFFESFSKSLDCMILISGLKGVLMVLDMCVKFGMKQEFGYGKIG